MLNYPTLSHKQNITIYKDGEKYDMIDLLSKTYNGDAKLYGNYFVVTKEYIARPDLISFASYGSDAYADLICKVNGISNPFELNEDMIIFVPLPQYFAQLVIAGNKNELVSKSKVNSNGTNDNIFAEFNTSMLDNTKLKEELKNDLKNKNLQPSTIGKEIKNNKKLKTERRSPGEQTVDDVNYVIDRSLGVVIY
jgi:hypothetical protein